MKRFDSLRYRAPECAEQSFAVDRIQKHLDITGMLFDGEYRFTKMVADFYEVDTSTIGRYLSLNSDELKHNMDMFLCKE